MLRFEWDGAKNRSNKKKHGVDFETAQEVFEDPRCVNFVDRVVGNEQRWIAIGRAGAVLLIVAHTYFEDAGNETIRMISARPATVHERKLYAETIDSQEEGPGGSSKKT